MSASTRLAPELVSLLEAWPLFDSVIIRHGFVPYMRDYEVEAVAMAAAPDGSRAYTEGRYRFRFSHCVVADAVTAVRDDVWQRSWDELYTDYGSWEAAGCPEGYVWGVNEMTVYPGATYDPDSARAAEWSRRLGRPMHEVRIETNAHDLTLVFHSVRVHRTARGDAATGNLISLEAAELLSPAT